MQTCLYASHIDAGGKMVDFSGWQMPIHYGSQIEEHIAVRQHAGVFDVSHMTVIDVTGKDATTFFEAFARQRCCKTLSSRPGALFRDAR